MVVEGEDQYFGLENRADFQTKQPGRHPPSPKTIFVIPGL
jgi:hypothetical protein